MGGRPLHSAQRHPQAYKTGLCTLSDGVGPLAGFSARIVVTHTPERRRVSVQLGWHYRFDPLPGKISDLRNRNPVQIPLRVATIERVDIRRGAERDQPALDSTRAGQAGDFFVGAKSACRNMAAGSGEPPTENRKPRAPHSTTTTLPQLPN